MGIPQVGKSLYPFLPRHPEASRHSHRKNTGKPHTREKEEGQTEVPPALVLSSPRAAIHARAWPDLLYVFLGLRHMQNRKGLHYSREHRACSLLPP